MENRTVEHHNLREVLGANMRRARKAAGLTLEAIAARLSGSQLAPEGYIDGSRSLNADTYKQWELGRNPVRIDWIPALCDVLDCDPGFLFGEYPQHHRHIADICTVTGLSEKAASNWKAHDYFGTGQGEKIPFPDQSGFTPSEVLSHLMESEAFWRVLGNISWWSKTGVLEASKQLDQYDPTDSGIPIIPGIFEPNPAIVPFKEDARELYMAAATKRFGDAVEEIFADLLEQQRRSSPPTKETAVTLEEEQSASSETSIFYDRQSADRQRMREEANRGVEDLHRVMKTSEK